MDIKKTLKNPFALVAQGFVVGAVLFWATMPHEQEAPQPTRTQAIQAQAVQALSAQVPADRLGV